MTAHQHPFTVFFLLTVVTCSQLHANGGPFLIKYPDGDPSAKGVLARLDPTLLPVREERLRVIKEELDINFSSKSRYNRRRSPVAEVTASYRIENPTGQEIAMDFGFPILRGIYTNPYGMFARPEVRVTIDEKDVSSVVISNSAIYGSIRQQARTIIEKSIASDDYLKETLHVIREIAGRHHQQFQTVRKQQRKMKESKKKDNGNVLYNDKGLLVLCDKLRQHLVQQMGWEQRDAELMVAYCLLNLKPLEPVPSRGRGFLFRDAGLRYLQHANIAELRAIGEQKATQFFAQLANNFDKQSVQRYENIFKAWGGIVQERSIDLLTGTIRPREMSMRDGGKALKEGDPTVGDPTIYARVNYLDAPNNLTAYQNRICNQVLNNLKVIFTFAPMNILYYRTTFAPESIHTVTVRYSQYAYVDTQKPKSYQLAYVLHPASLWNSFGPIHLKIHMPEGVKFRSSISCYTQKDPYVSQKTAVDESGQTPASTSVTYTALLTEPHHKKGELFVAVDADGWNELTDKRKNGGIKTSDARR